MMGQLLDLSDFSNCRRDISELWMRLQTNVSDSGRLQGTIELTLWVQFQSMSYSPPCRGAPTMRHHFSPRDVVPRRTPWLPAARHDCPLHAMIVRHATRKWTNIKIIREQLDSYWESSTSPVQSSTELSPVAISSADFSDWSPLIRLIWVVLTHVKLHSVS